LAAIFFRRSGWLGRIDLGRDERRFLYRAAPALDPNLAAGRKLGDDLVGDFLTKAFPVPTGASMNGGV
jgi:hypothetical protein